MSRTIMETYYAINQAITTYLAQQGVAWCPVVQSGIDVATLKKDLANSADVKYPYIQTWMGNIKPQSWTSNTSGTLTDFDFQMSFFTSPEDEFQDTSKYFYPFEVVKNGFSDIDANILLGIATIKTTEGPFDFSMKSGSGVNSSVMLYRMRTLCRYSAHVPPATISTNIDNAISITEKT